MMRPHILLIPDTEKWAFDFCANQIIQHLSHKYRFTKMYNYIEKKQVAAIDATNYDMVFRYIAFPMDITSKVPKQKLLTSIRSQSAVERRPENFTSELMLKSYNSVSVVAKCLRSLLPQKCCPIFDTQNGVDADLFKPMPHRHDFTIAFAGNSKHPNDKGMDMIVEAAKLANVKCLTADRKDKWIAHEQMPEFYKEIDVYVCMSKSEGMPNTVLEAASCGKPVISTPCGGVPEVITHGRTGLLIERRMEVLVEAIQQLKNDKELYHFMSENTRNNIINNWCWSKMVKKYETWFDFALSIRGAE